VLKYTMVSIFHFALALFTGIIIRRKQLKLSPAGLVNPLTPGGAGRFVVAMIGGVLDMKAAFGWSRKQVKLLKSGWDIVGIWGLFSGVLMVEFAVLSCSSDCLANPFIPLIFVSLWGAFAGCITTQLLTRPKREAN
jgi:hypothetical protein